MQSMINREPPRTYLALQTNVLSSSLASKRQRKEYYQFGSKLEVSFGHSSHRCQQLRAFTDFANLRDNIFTAGSDALQRLGKQLEPFPSSFPPGPSGEVALRFLSDPLGFSEETSDRYGPLVSLRLAGERVVLVADSAAAEQLLITENTKVTKEGTAFFPGSRLAGNGLLVSDGELWQRQRQLSNPAFRKNAVQSYTQAMLRSARHLVDHMWPASGVRDVYLDFNKVTLQIVTDALFGFHASTPESETVTNAVRIAMEYFASRAATGFAIPEWLPTPDNSKYNQAVSQLDTIVYGIIDERRRSSSRQPATCLLDNLLASKDDYGQGMSDKALRDELMTLLIAGQETSAIVLGWTCAFLADHPLHQERVRQEIDRNIGSDEVSSHSASELHYLESVVLESMRLRPPAYMVGRCIQSPVSLHSYTLTPGTTTLISPYLLHRDGRIWARSKEFTPQRWLPHLEGQKPGTYMSLLSGLGPNKAYLPFGAGPRNCIGTYFAMTEVILVLATLLQKYRLSPSPGHGHPKPDAKITLRPASVHLCLDRQML